MKGIPPLPSLVETGEPGKKEKTTNGQTMQIMNEDMRKSMENTTLHTFFMVFFLCIPSICWVQCLAHRKLVSKCSIDKLWSLIVAALLPLKSLRFEDKLLGWLFTWWPVGWNSHVKESCFHSPCHHPTRNIATALLAFLSLLSLHPLSYTAKCLFLKHLFHHVTQALTYPNPKVFCGLMCS